jgi:hypothetical protein
MVAKENRALWVEALRSGRFTQTRGILTRTLASDKEPVGDCCLGVACKVFNENVGGLEVTSAGPDDYCLEYEGQRVDLPTVVANWLGISPSMEEDVNNELANRNDGVWRPREDFSSIADLIESEPKGWFIGS